jgi:16S rRNA (guanine527-N7)-methyltransferase
MAYLDQLNRWNKTYNLTAIIDPKEQVYKHIIDSLSIRDTIIGPNVCDVGTGPGLPGIPLAIALPNIHFTLVDSSQKRIIFIQQAVIKLGIKNVTAVQQRIEEMTPPNEGFNTIISRAFSSLLDFAQKTQHLLADNGQLLAMKGVYPSDELAQIEQDFQVVDVRKLTISGLDAERHLVIIKQRAPGGENNCNR